uniref:Inositol hexakisphosphate and diphosphoinositol-pentakisphosphate kinase n=1 Tax=Globisporangium ultimum (strain ATCC 200006 / CBS 805.95 / DAOM BR144) TaxID=431595 RepID=K3X2Z1_GLOUD
MSSQQLRSSAARGDNQLSAALPPPAPPRAAASSGDAVFFIPHDDHSAGPDDDDDPTFTDARTLLMSNVDAKYTVGICVMDKKAESKPMLEILARLPRHLFRVVFFGDDRILNDPIEQWPLCDALISFFSTGFPLEKAKAYVALRNPVVVNDLGPQDLLMDRRDVYRILEEHKVPIPRHVVVNRDGYRGAPVSEVMESEDYLEVDGVRISKPFVEKPVDGEDHNINIYYPMNAGGGCKRLFRKVGNRSSEYDAQVNTVRQSGSFIYEEFLSTQGVDVKVYTVGPNYAHAEARKSPVLDGRVMRDEDGKEVRYPVILSTKEKEVAYKVCRAFGQTICGFDILRVHDASYVCDVNGWSFVKNSEKYYDDCAMLLSKYLEQSLNGSSSGEGFGCDHSAFTSPIFRVSDGSFGSELSEPLSLQKEHQINVNDPAYHEEELRCVLAVIRHGDRTPKQKMKMNVCHPSFLGFYEQKVGASSKKKDLKIKGVADLEHLLQVAKELIRLYEERDPEFLQFLIEREDVYNEDPGDRVKGYRTLRDVLQRWQLVGINRKVQLKPKEYTLVPSADGTTQEKRVSKLLLIIKWGGDLTHSGEEQAEHLGQKFRQMMYPGGEGGLIRLHSTYRHDLKIYTSDEGRVQKTAASFAKGLLELEGALIPILVGLVLKSKDADSMLDQSGSSAQEIIMKVKQRLHKIIHRDDNCSELMDSDSQLIRSVAQALTKVDQPIKKMEIMHKLLNSLKEQLTKAIQEKAQAKAWQAKKLETVASRFQTATIERSRSVNSMPTGSRNRHIHSYADTNESENNNSKNKLKSALPARLSDEELKHPEPCGRETLEVMRERWAKLHRDFYIKKTDTYDLSKIPDIHDCMRYDAIHNAHLHLTSIRELLDIASSLAHALVPQEYGIDVDEKVYIGSAMCRTLLMKIRDDLDLARGLKLHTHRLNPSYAKNKHEIKSTHRSVRTRLYFTSESHLHTLLNVLRFGRDDCPVKSPVGEEARKWIEGIPELCYMTHFVVRVFERFQYAQDDPQRFRLEISLSPGADQDPLSADPEKQVEVAPLKIISREGLCCQELVDYLADVIEFAERNLENQTASVAISSTSSNDSTAGDNPEDESAEKNLEELKRTGYVLSGNSSSSSAEIEE